MSDSRAKYYELMESKSQGNLQKKPRVLRSFKVGDEVTRYRPTKSKRVNKLAPLQEGPFIVTEALPNGVSYKIKRQGSGEAEVKVHVDDMNSFTRWADGDQNSAASSPSPLPTESTSSSAQQPSSSAQQPDQQPQQLRSSRQKYKVVEVMDERGRGTSKHEYLLRWDGTQEDGSPWKCSWNQEKDLDCHLLIMNWEMASGRERGRRRRQAAEIGIDDGYVCVVREIGQEVQMLRADILDMVRQQRERGSVVQQVCDHVGIKMEEILLVWASPPCETYTEALTEEILGAARRKHKHEKRRRYVLDLFAGSGSLAPVVRRAGCVYVPVDVCLKAMKKNTSVTGDGTPL